MRTKLQKIWSLLILIFFCSSCQNKKPSIGANIILANEAKYIDFLDLYMDMPANYAPIAALGQQLLEEENPEKQEKLLWIQDAADKGLDLSDASQLFYDTDKLSTIVTFYTHESLQEISFTKYDATVVTKQMEYYFKQLLNGYGQSLKRLSKKYIKIADATIIKLKFKIGYDGGRDFMTNYLIQRKGVVFYIIVKSKNTYDFHAEVRAILEKDLLSQE